MRERGMTFKQIEKLADKAARKGVSWVETRAALIALHGVPEN